MAGDAAGAEVDELAADIGGEVGDALQVAGEADAGDVVFHGGGAVEDGGAGVGAVLAAHGIHGVIAVDDLVSQEEVIMPDSQQGIAQHARGEQLHGLKVKHFLPGQSGQPGHQNGALGNVAAEVGHALHGGVDFDAGDDGAQITRYGLVEGQEFQAFLLDADFLAVDDFIVGHDAASLLGIAGAEGLDGVVDGAFGQFALGGNLGAQGIEFVDEVLFHDGGSVRVNRSGR